MAFYPLMIQLEGKKVLIVGGGRVALRKYRSLSGGGAVCTVASPRLCAGLAQMHKTGKLEWIRSSFSPSLLRGAALAVACTDDSAVNQLVRQSAAHLCIPVCLCDDAASSDFIFPAAARRGDVTIAVSTMGGDPSLAKQLKNRILAALPASLGPAQDLSGGEYTDLKNQTGDVENETKQTESDFF